MIRKEKEPHSNKEIVLSTGQWNENISWNFVLSTEIPQKDLCTAVCCVTIYDKKLLLVKNKRGWELPAGKIDNGESVEDAIIREVREETGADIHNPKVFGYKKLTTLQPIPRPETPDIFYPFPHSYVVFFYASANTLNSAPGDDIHETTLINYSEAQTFLKEKGQYTNILKYLREKEVLDID